MILFAEVIINFKFLAVSLHFIPLKLKYKFSILFNFSNQL
jgi:hypothetical protein